MTARVTESRTDGNEPNGEASVCRLLQTFPLGSFLSVLLSSLLSSYFLRSVCPTFFDHFRLSYFLLPGSYTVSVLKTGQPKKCKSYLIYFAQIVLHPTHPRLVRHATTFSSWRGVNDWARSRFDH